jgi:GT2 family glycosyltransferase
VVGGNAVNFALGRAVYYHYRHAVGFQLQKVFRFIRARHRYYAIGEAAPHFLERLFLTRHFPSTVQQNQRIAALRDSALDAFYKPGVVHARNGGDDQRQNPRLALL